MIPSVSSPFVGSAPLPDIVIVDSCVLLNLCASGRAEDILASISRRCLLPAYARDEALWYEVRSAEPSAAATRRDVEIASLEAAGLLEVVELTSEEQELFVTFAQQLGDGEAASGALATARAGVVATDDAKARRVFGRLSPPIQTVGTPTLLKHWQLRSRIGAAVVARVLRSIRSGARYAPGRNDPDEPWWREHDNY